MALYQFKCNCGNVVNVSASINIGPPESATCDICQARTDRRNYSRFATKLQNFDPHFNHTVGKVVHSMSEFRDELKRGSEEQSARTGIDHNYIPMEHNDLKPKDYDNA